MLDQSILLMYQTMQKPPQACAHITGSSEIHNLIGDVYVYPFLEGSLLVADVEGIPFSGFYGFHIHQHGPCIVGEGYTGFEDVGGHYTTVENAPHPYHAGDLPVLMALYGHAYMIVYTDRFKPQDILGKAMIIHEWPDDYRTQPTGDFGTAYRMRRVFFMALASLGDSRSSCPPRHNQPNLRRHRPYRPRR